MKHVQVTAFSEEASDVRRFALVCTCIYRTTHNIAEYMMKLKITVMVTVIYLCHNYDVFDVPKDYI